MPKVKKNKADYKYTITFKKPVKVKSITSTGITFTDGTKLTDYHEQDCCESVYADWEKLKDTSITLEEYESLHIWGKKEVGIILSRGYAVNCYNSQNGYYSSNLELIIKRPGEEEVTIDISEYVEDNID